MLQKELKKKDDLLAEFQKTLLQKDRELEEKERKSKNSVQKQQVICTSDNVLMNFDMY